MQVLSGSGFSSDSTDSTDIDDIATSVPKWDREAAAKEILQRRGILWVDTNCSAEEIDRDAEGRGRDDVRLPEREGDVSGRQQGARGARAGTRSFDLISEESLWHDGTPPGSPGASSLK
jgi:hypothetical protein